MMASTRLIQAFQTSQTGVRQVLHYFVRDYCRLRVCSSCGCQNFPVREFSNGPRQNLTEISLQRRFVSRSTRAVESREENDAEIPVSSRPDGFPHGVVNPAQTDGDRNARSFNPESSVSDKAWAKTVVDAENNQEYFKRVTVKAQESAQMAAKGIDWEQYTDPDKPEDSVKSRAPENRFGGAAASTYPNPLAYPLKKKAGKAVEAQDEIDNVDWKEMERNDPENRPFEPVSDVDPSLREVEPALQPFSHNLAAYANVSDNVKKLVAMGVEVWKLDKDPEMSQRMMTAEWGAKIQPWIDWMKETGLTDYDISVVFGRHPRIIKEGIPHLQSRVDYFISKKFAKEAIAQLVTRAPQAFSWNVKYIDKRLGELQRTFKLTGNEMRRVITGQPKLIILPALHWKLVKYGLVNELGFTVEEAKQMLIGRPKIYRQAKQSLVDRFDYLHNVCKFPHTAMMQFPEALLVRKFRSRERHLFLKSLRKNQYDPKLPGFVSLKALISGRDVEFCTDVAKVPVEVFNEFIKTL